MPSAKPRVRNREGPSKHVLDSDTADARMCELGEKKEEREGGRTDGQSLPHWPVTPLWTWQKPHNLH